jgi:hypothetical protein
MRRWKGLGTESGTNNSTMNEQQQTADASKRAARAVRRARRRGGSVRAHGDTTSGPDAHSPSPHLTVPREHEAALPVQETSSQAWARARAACAPRAWLFMRTSVAQPPTRALVLGERLAPHASHGTRASHGITSTSQLAGLPAAASGTRRAVALKLRCGDCCAVLRVQPACRRDCGRVGLTCTATRTSAIVAKQRRCGRSCCALSDGFVLTQRVRRASGSDAVEHRQRGLLPKDAATWEANAFVAFCRTARADAAVSKALALLEARASARPQPRPGVRARVH